MESLNSMITHINESFEKADNYNSKCTNEILKMEGMSGKKTRQYTFIIIFVQFKEYDN